MSKRREVAKSKGYYIAQMVVTWMFILAAVYWMVYGGMTAGWVITLAVMVILLLAFFTMTLNQARRIKKVKS